MHETLLRQIQRHWFQIWQYFSKLLSKITKQNNVVLDSKIFIFPQTLHSDKLKGNSDEQIPVKKYTNKALLILNLFILIARNYAIKQIWGHWFQLYLAQKYPNWAFFCSKSFYFYFCTKIYNKKNSRVLISNATITFWNLRQIRHFWLKFKNILVSSETLLLE